MNWGRFWQNRTWCVPSTLLRACAEQSEVTRVRDAWVHYGSRIMLFLLLGIGLLARPQSLFAHNELRQSIPAAGAVLPASPPEIHLLFSETPAGVFVKLFDRQFQEIPGLEILPTGSTATEVVALVPELANGTYTVQWLTLAADNHTVTGTFQFEVQQTSPPVFSNGVIGGVLAAAVLSGVILFIRQNRKREVSSEQ